MKSAKIILGMIAFIAILGLSSAKPAQAELLKNANLELSDSRANQLSVHTFNFDVNSTDDIKEMRFTYCQQASVSCTAPTGMDARAATLTSVTVDSAPDASFTITTDFAALIITSSGTAPVEPDNPIEVVFDDVANPNINGCTQPAGLSTATCYVNIRTYSDTGSTLIDDTTVSMTIVASVEVTAKVDPTFSFIVAGVNASTVSNGITTSVQSAYNTLPFGNLTAGTPRYAAHKLTVNTNTQSGYTVTAEMQTQLTGIYSVNNIDPFNYNGVVWGTPATWTNPGGATPNTNTGWIGANTTGFVAGWNNSTGKFGPIGSVQATVMSSSASDNGSVPIYVTYVVEANVYQPSDAYTGTLMYIALPTY